MRYLAQALAVSGFLFIGASPQQASAATVSAHVTSRCAPKMATIVVPGGKKAVNFTVRQLQNGLKCRGGGKPDAKGWGITKRGRKVYYWTRWRNKKPHVIGGPLNRVKLAPGTYHVFVDGGRGAQVRVTYSLR